jgi:hypothetical protein
MKKLAVVIALAAVAAVAVAGLVARNANAAAAAGDPRIAKLQKQVRSLQTQVTALVKVDAILRDQLALNFEGDTCSAAQLSDLIQGTWGVIDQIAQTAQQKTYFGPQTPVSDYANCGDLAQPSVPRPGIVVPPTIAPLGPLMEWLHEPLWMRN